MHLDRVAGAVEDWAGSQVMLAHSKRMPRPATARDMREKTSPAHSSGERGSLSLTKELVLAMEASSRVPLCGVSSGGG